MSFEVSWYKLPKSYLKIDEKDKNQKKIKKSNQSATLLFKMMSVAKKELLYETYTTYVTNKFMVSSCIGKEKCF